MRRQDLQGQLWSTSPANWAKYIEPAFIPLYRQVLKQAALHEESALLDAGCGSGLFLSMAAGTGALIHGIDAAPGMLAIAKQRVPGAYLMVEDLNGLPYIDGSFDVVTGLNSFDYSASFEFAIAEARRVVKRHGKVIFTTWSNTAVNEAQSILDAARLQSKDPMTTWPFNTIADEDMSMICKRTGLKIVSTTAVYCPWTFTSDTALLEGFLSTGDCAVAVQEIGEAVVSNAILDAAQHYNMADEVYYLQNTFTVHVTEKI